MGRTASMIICCLAVASCGRSVQLGANLTGADGGNPTDTTGPCNPSCEEICRDLVSHCLADWPCESRCNNERNDPVMRCLAQLVCDATGPADCLGMQACFENPAAPDLQVLAFASNNANQRRIRYNAEICNRGGTATTLEVHFYRDREGPPRVGDVGNRIVRINAPLAAGQCRDVSATDDSLPPGTYVTWVQVDARNAVAELNEQNNVGGPLKVTVGGNQLPDLRVVDFSAEQGPDPLSVIYFTSVCNRGKTTSGPTQLGLYLDLPSPPGPQLPDHLVPIPPLPPAECIEQEIYWPLSPGTYTSWAMIDPLLEVAESDEQNNIAGPQTVAIGGGPLTDLVVTHFDAAGMPAGAALKATVCNYGGGAVSTSLSIYTDRSSAPPPHATPDLVYNVPLLSPGGCTSVGGPVSLPPGSYSAWAFVDSDNKVVETDEGNNIKGPVKFSVGGTNDIDLVVQSLTAKAGSSNAVYYQTIVCNFGGDNATSVNLGLFHNRSSAPGAYSTANKTIYLSMVPAGGCVSASTSSYLQPGTYNSWAYVDMNDAIAEDSENNNVAGPVQVVVGAGDPDLQIASFVAGAAVGGAFYGAQICNEGGSPSGPFNLGFYYDRPTTPAAGDLPDHTLMVPTLAAGACDHAGTFVSIPAGTYNSWAFVDVYDGVAESVETNNTAGPQSFTVSSVADPPCTTICNALVSPCNLLPSAELQQCVDACDLQPPEAVACALEATVQQQCNDIMPCLAL